MSEISCMETMPCIKQGDAYDLRIALDLNGEALTAAHLPLLECVEFMLGDSVRRVWPEEGGFLDGSFLVPLTQADTFSLEDGETVEFDARVRFVGGAVVGLKKKLRVMVCDALSEEELR